MGALRTAFRLVDRVSPAWAGQLGRRLFLRAPRRRRSLPEEQAVLSHGRRFTVTSDRNRLAAWRFGAGPTILLVHGWGGNAAQLAPYVEPLVDAGFTVVAYDGPGHGASTGSTTSLVHLGRAVLDVAQTVGPVHGVITHSVGGAATAFAWSRGLETERAVLIAPPADAVVWFEAFASAMALPERTKQATRRAIEAYVGVSFDQLNVRAMGPPAGVDLLVIHDRKDREVRFEDGELIASLGGGRLVATSGLGHRRIVADPGIVSTARRFLAPDAPDLQSVIDRELFDPSLRPAA